MHPTTKNIVKTHSCAVQISHRATLNQYRAWLVLLKNSMPRVGEPSAATHKMRLADLWREMGNGERRANRNDAYLKNLLRGLVDVQVEWNILGKEKEAEWGIASLLAGCRIRGGMVEWDYSAFLWERLHAPRMFALLNLGIVNRFSSKYALALYCVAADYKGLSATPFIPIDKFRHLMGLDAGEYTDFRALNRRLIKEPLAEINSVSDLAINAEYVKEYRRVSAVRFHVRKNPNWKPAPRPQVAAPKIPTGGTDAPLTASPPSPVTSSSAPIPPPGAEMPPPQGTPAPPSNALGADLPLRDANMLRRLVFRFGFAETTARKLMVDSDRTVLRSNVELGENAIQRKSLDNPSGWLLAALAKDFAAPARASKTKQLRRHREAVAAFKREMVFRKFSVES